MRPRRFFAFWSIAVLLLAGCDGSVDAPQNSPEALKALSAASDFYRQQPGFRVESQVGVMIYNTDGEPLEGVSPLAEQRTIVVEASNRWMLQGGEFRVASDGTSLRTNRMLPAQVPETQTESESGEQASAERPPSPARSNESDVYWRGEALEGPSQLAESQLGSLFGGAANLLCLNMIEPGLSETLLGGDNVVFDHGRETVNGKPARHLQFEKPAAENAQQQPRAVTELWVAAEGDPLLLQYKHTSLPQTMTIGRIRTVAVVVVKETFGDWQFGVDEPESTFLALPGSRRVADLGQLVMPASRLIGRPAPDLELPLVDGSSVWLTDLKQEGKIVLLDFWATYCGPCRYELPFVAQLAEEHADLGVVLYAVNQGEPPEVVKAFLRQQSFELTTALDETGEISYVFGASSVPYLCIIGRDGTVQVVHVGVGPGTESAVREELAALIAGRNLAVDGLPE